MTSYGLMPVLPWQALARTAVVQHGGHAKAKKGSTRGSPVLTAINPSGGHGETSLSNS